MILTNINISKYIFISLPIIFLTGPFLTDLAVVLISLQFLILSLSKRSLTIYKTTFVYFFFSFYLLIIISGILSVDTFSSLILFDGPIFYIRYLFFSLAIIYLLNLDNRLVKYFFISLSISTLFLIIDTSFQWTFNYNLLGIVDDNPRVSSVFGKEKVLGHYLGFISPILFCLSLFFSNVNKKFLLIGFLIFFLSILISIISGDRTGLLKLILFAFTAVFFMKNYKKYFIFLVLISLFFAYQLVKNDEDINNRFNQTIDEITKTTIPYLPLTKLHQDHFNTAYVMFLDKPIIGHGPQGFRLSCHNNQKYNSYNGCNNHPHNYYSQLLSELGIFGFFTITLIFFYLIFLVLRNLCINYFVNELSDTKLINSLLICCLILNIFPVMAHFNFYNNWVNAMLFLNISIILFFSKKFINTIL